MSDESEVTLFHDVEGRLSLLPSDLGLDMVRPFNIDWSEGDTHYRSQRYQHELIVRAVMGRQRHYRCVIDCTAGLGRDALILASQGLSVLLLERSSIIYRLLEDALSRALLMDHLRPIAEQMVLYHKDASDWLCCDDVKAYIEDNDPVIYCDPMFPSSQKKAKVKKEMQVFQALLKEAEPEKISGQAVYSEEMLIQAAMNSGASKVVIKRPLKSDYKIKKPSYSLKGKTVRFDIYQNLS